MEFYIQIAKLNGRSDFCELASKLDERGYSDRVEYHPGGWIDNKIHTVLPHLRFLNEDDAIAYVLSYGGNITRDIPVNNDTQ